MGIINNTGVFLLVLLNCAHHVCHAVKLLRSDYVLPDHLHKAKLVAEDGYVNRGFNIGVIRVAIYRELLEPRGVENKTEQSRCIGTII